MAEFTRNFSLVKPDFNFSPWHDDVNNNFDLIDSIVFAFTGVGNVKGEWNNDEIYTQGDRVVDGDQGTLWQCVTSHTSPSFPVTFEEDRDANPGRWNQISEPRLIPAAEWETGVNYSVNQILFDGLTFGIVLRNYTSGASFDADVANGDVGVIFSIELAGLVSEEQLTITLAAYATTEAVNSALAAYATIASVNSILESYSTTAQINTILEDYATIASVNSALEDYSTTAQINSILENYSTTAQINTILEDYVTLTQLQSILEDYARLDAANTFTEDQTVDGDVFVTGVVEGGTEL